MTVNRPFGYANKLFMFEEIEKKVVEVKQRIVDAALRSGRSGDDVLMVAVSKYAEPNDGVVESFLRAGIRNLAENRPQMFLSKVEYLQSSGNWDYRGPKAFVSPSQKECESDNSLRWHFIGNLQRNKVRRILPYTTLIHSIDSWKLLQTIDRILEEESCTPEESVQEVFPDNVSVLLEVHISNDDTKQGFSHDEVKKILANVDRLKHIEVVGLMGMAGLTATSDEIRRQFASLRRTLEECRSLFPELVKFRELSMGMSGDFEIAIEEGATIVRIGSSLYPEGS